MRDKSFRREQYAKHKAKARRLLKGYFSFSDEEITPALLGARAETFSVCGCSMCRNERRNGVITMQEKKADIDFEQQLESVA